VIEAIADPSVQAITVTVTEKGYHLTPDGRSIPLIRILPPM
jgi:mannitol-1-phosphate/altronate dehydrogenase